MVSAAVLKFEKNLSDQRKNSTGKSCALATVVRVVLHAKKNEPTLAAEKKIVSYKRFGFVRSAFPNYDNIIGDVRSPERYSRVKAAATENEKLGAAKRLCSNQKSTFLLRELVSHLSQS